MINIYLSVRDKYAFKLVFGECLDPQTGSSEV
jgi:hypothetical protein